MQMAHPSMRHFYVKARLSGWQQGKDIVQSIPANFLQSLVKEISQAVVLVDTAKHADRSDQRVPIRQGLRIGAHCSEHEAQNAKAKNNSQVVPVGRLRAKREELPEHLVEDVVIQQIGRVSQRHGEIPQALAVVVEQGIFAVSAQSLRNGILHPLAQRGTRLVFPRFPDSVKELGLKIMVRPNPGEHLDGLSAIENELEIPE
jgi:hypothetical protein